MKKLMMLVPILLSTYSGMTQAGGNAGWDQNSVNPRECVVGTYDRWVFSDESKCTDGIAQGKITGVRITGFAEMPDWSDRRIDGVVSPSSSVKYPWDNSKGERPRGVYLDNEWVN